MYFVDDDKVVNDTQDEVVAHQENEKEMQMAGIEVDDLNDTDDEPDTDETIDADESENNQEVADPDGKPKQTIEENKVYAKLRRQAEAEIKAKFEKQYEADRKELEEQKLKLKQFEKEQEIMSQITRDKIWELANEKGVSEEVAEEILQLKAKTEIEKEKLKVREQFLNRKKEIESLRSKTYFNDLEHKIHNFLEQNPTWDAVNAYNFLLGQNADELVSTNKKKAEKRTIANLQDKMKRRNISSDSEPEQSVKGLSDFGRKAAAFMGVDQNRVAQHKKKRLQELGK